MKGQKGARRDLRTAMDARWTANSQTVLFDAPLPFLFNLCATRQADLSLRIRFGA